MIEAELKQRTSTVPTTQQSQDCSVNKPIYGDGRKQVEREGLSPSRHDEAQCSRQQPAVTPLPLDFAAHHFNQEPGGSSPILGKSYRWPP